jgi:GMP synthase (glutamine-hydrolysing)
MSTRPSVLVVEHEEGAPAGWLGEWLVEEGLRLDVRRPYAGEDLPADLTAHAGLLVLGGGMDAWDDDHHDWLDPTRALVRLAEETRTPALGLCLGHQLAVLALGGEVGRNPAGATIAVMPVGWLEGASDDPVLGPVTTAARASHWNVDVATRLPEDARVLARTPDGAPQAARLGQSVWGVQCHPEAGPAILQRWADDDGEPHRAAGVDVDGFLADAARSARDLHDGWRPLGRSFAVLVHAAEAMR